MSRSTVQVSHVQDGKPTTSHGWDADRLVHNEDSQGIRHTVYEPDSFVPLLQLQRAKGAPSAMQHMLGGSEAALQTWAAQRAFLERGLEHTLEMAPERI